MSIAHAAHHANQIGACRTNFEEAEYESVIQVRVTRQRFLLLVYAAIVLGFCWTFGVGVLALTVEPDEVWNLMSTMKAFGIPLPPTSALDSPVTTTGGLHFLIHGLIGLWQRGDIFVHRLVSIGFTLTLLAIVFKIVEHHVKDRVLAIAGTALFSAAPGFLLQASLATSEIIATTVFLLATLFWVRFGHLSMRMAILGGVLFGLACATRMTCLSMLPAVLVWSAVAQRGWVARFAYPLVAVALAVLVYIGFVAVYFAAFGDTPWSEFMVASGGASGVSNAFPGLMMRLNFVVVGDGIIPILAIFALAGWFLSRLDDGGDDREIIGLCGFLLLAGSAGWLAWVLKAPIPHIRYLWPAIPLLWLAAILLGLSAVARIKRVRTIMITHLVLILMCTAQGLLNMRMLAVGDSLALVYEIARGSRLGTPKDYFEPRRNQEAMAKLVSSLDSSANIQAFSAPSAYPMTFLSGRTVKSFPQPNEATAMDFLLVQPSDYSIWRTRWDLIRWMQNNTTLVEQRGDYALYRVHEGAQWSAR